MGLVVAIGAKPDELKKQLIVKVSVCQVVNLLDWFGAATLANTVFTLKNEISLRSPFR